MSDFKRMLLDAVGELLTKVAIGDITAEDAQREIEICKALNELLVMRIETKRREAPAASLEEHLQREQAMLAAWPEACRRAGFAVIDLPEDLIQHLLRAATLRYRHAQFCGVSVEKYRSPPPRPLKKYADLPPLAAAPVRPASLDDDRPRLDERQRGYLQWLLDESGSRDHLIAEIDDLVQSALARRSKKKKLTLAEAVHLAQCFEDAIEEFRNPASPPDWAEELAGVMTTEQARAKPMLAAEHAIYLMTEDDAARKLKDQPDDFKRWRWRMKEPRLRGQRYLKAMRAELQRPRRK